MILDDYLRRGNHVTDLRLKHFLRRTVPLPVQELLGRSADWAIGVCEGTSPTDLAGRGAPILTRASVTDADVAFVADPFALFHNGLWHLFFEVMNRSSGKGEIALASSADLRTWSYDGIVLAEPFHLSYPHVFESGGVLHLIPESWEAGAVRHYRADRPGGPWTPAGILVEAPVLLDPTPVRHDGRWWLFAETNPRHTYDTLRLWGADALEGPWREHPASPVVVDAASARPAGRIVHDGTRLLRWGQDCSRRYGAQARAFQIVELDPGRYREVPVAVTLDAGGWAAATHHVDAHRVAADRWVAFVDGHAGGRRR